jgi:hypothetical protein
MRATLTRPARTIAIVIPRTVEGMEMRTFGEEQGALRAWSETCVRISRDFEGRHGGELGRGG